MNYSLSFSILENKKKEKKTDVIFIALGTKHFSSQASIFVRNSWKFLSIIQKLKTLKIYFIPAILFKIGYVKHWWSRNLTKIISNMDANNSFDNWGLKSLIVPENKYLCIQRQQNIWLRERYTHLVFKTSSSLALFFMSFQSLWNFSNFPLYFVNLCPNCRFLSPNIGIFI